MDENAVINHDDDSASRLGLDPVVNADPHVPRIVIRVAPRLLGDALGVALRERGLDVVLYPEESTATVGRAGEGGRFDLALVTEELPADATAETTITLDEAGTALSVDREGYDRTLATSHELEGLLELIDQLLDDRRVQR